MVATLATAVAVAIVAGGPEHSAVAALEEGRPSAALQLVQQARQKAADAPEAALTEPQRSTLRLVEAFAALRLRRAQQGAEALEAIATQGPTMGSYLLFLRVGAMATLGRCAEAQGLAQQLPEDSAFSFGAWSRVTSCALQARDGELAERALASTVRYAQESSTQQSQVALMQAEVAETLGRSSEASTLYRQVLVDFPLHRAGRQARQRLGLLRRRGVAVQPLEVADLLPRAEAQRTWRQSGRARRTYRSVVSRSRRRNLPNLRDQAELGLVELDIVDRAYGRALRRLTSMLQRVDDDELRAHALFLKTDVLARRGRVAEALETAEAALSEVPEATYTTEAVMLAARLAQGSGRLDRAQQLAEWILQAEVTRDGLATIDDSGAHTRRPDADGIREEALWLIALVKRLDSEDGEAVDATLAQIPEDSHLGAAATYWRARHRVATGDLDGAEALANRILEREPTSFYAFAASELVGAVRPGCSVRFGLPERPEDLAKPPKTHPQDLLGAVVLFSHGLLGEARRALEAVPSHLLSYADRLSAAWLHRNCGNVHRAALLTRALVAAPEPSVDSAILLELAYPRAFADIVVQEAAARDVPEELIFAVIREESAFNPQAISPRQARGLMQMIRPTARAMARKAGLRRFRASQLFRPEISIRLGATYLRTLLDLFDGNLVAAIASYHAGETAVARWLRERGHLPLDEFIEEIPYTSTRGYVKKVLGSYGIYRLLRGRVDEPPLGLHEPCAKPASVGWATSAGHCTRTGGPWEAQPEGSPAAADPPTSEPVSDLDEPAPRAAGAASVAGAANAASPAEL